MLRRVGTRIATENKHGGQNGPRESLECWARAAGPVARLRDAAGPRHVNETRDRRQMVRERQVERRVADIIAGIDGAPRIHARLPHGCENAVRRICRCEGGVAAGPDLLRRSPPGGIGMKRSRAVDRPCLHRHGVTTTGKSDVEDGIGLGGRDSRLERRPDMIEHDGQKDGPERQAEPRQAASMAFKPAENRRAGICRSAGEGAEAGHKDDDRAARPSLDMFHAHA